MEETKESKILWAKKLINFINNFLSNFLDPNVVKLLTTIKENINIWVTAFTHETYSEKNNEELEFLGDRIFMTTFSLYLMKMLPHLNKDEFSNLSHDYTGNKFFAYLYTDEYKDINNKINFHDYLRYKELSYPLNRYIKADLIEAFNGALFKCGNNIKNNFGYDLCYDFTVYIYKNIITVESFNNKKGDLRQDKTLVQQILRQLDKNATDKEIEHVTKDEFDNYIYQIVLTDTIIKILRDEDKQNINRIIGYGYGSKKHAENMAYKEARNKLDVLGIDKYFTEEYKFWKKIDSLKSIKNKIKEKMKRENIKYLKIKNPNKKFMGLKPDSGTYSVKIINKNNIEKDFLYKYYELNTEEVYLDIFTIYLNTPISKNYFD